MRVDEKTSLWYEIPDKGRKGALEKIRQGLRERASELMETLEVKKSESTLEEKVGFMHNAWQQHDHQIHNSLNFHDCTNFLLFKICY